MNCKGDTDQSRAFLCPVCGGTAGHAVVDFEIGNPIGRSFTVYACDRCGLGQTLPMPNRVELRRYYENYYTEKGPPGNRRTMALLKRTLMRGTSFRLAAISFFFRFLATHTMQVVLPAPFGSKKVLDIGCGYGRLLDLFRLQGWETYGVEPGAGGSEIARRNGHKVVHGELQAGTFDENLFSAVVLCHSLEHIPNPVEVLNETYKILRPGGLLVVEVPNAACAEAAFFGQAWDAWSIPYHLYHWTPLSLEKALRNAGFTVDRYRFKIPKFSDFKTNFRGLNRVRKISFSGALSHYAVTWFLGHIGLNRDLYGHYIALHAHKPGKVREL